jgi:hypothetical protein
MFNVGTSYDYYVVQNSPNKGKCKLKNTENEISIVDLNLMPFIPNTNYSSFEKLIAKSKEEKIQFIGDSSYHSQRDYVSKIPNIEFKYPVVWSVTQKVGVKFLYSNTKDKGHFNLPKVVFSHGGGSYPVVDNEGEWGLTEFGFGIVDSIENLENIKTALDSKEFIKLMSSLGFRNLKYEPKVIECFRKDFWKEFI